MDKNLTVLRKFSTNMIRKRYEKNISQLKLAEMVGCHLNTINSIEKKTFLPNLDLALKISKVLEISLDELVERALDEIEV